MVDCWLRQWLTPWLVDAMADWYNGWYIFHWRNGWYNGWCHGWGNGWCHGWYNGWHNGWYKLIDGLVDISWCNDTMVPRCNGWQCLIDAMVDWCHGCLMQWLIDAMVEGPRQPEWQKVSLHVSYSYTYLLHHGFGLLSFASLCFVRLMQWLMSSLIEAMFDAMVGWCNGWLI